MDTHFTPELADIYLGIDESEFGVGVGPDEHKFLHNYTRFLISQNLATINYSDYLIDWLERRIHPDAEHVLVLMCLLLSNILWLNSRKAYNCPKT